MLKLAAPRQSAHDSEADARRFFAKRADALYPPSKFSGDAFSLLASPFAAPQEQRCNSLKVMANVDEIANK